MRNKIIVLISLLVVAAVLAGCGVAASAQALSPAAQTTPSETPRTLNVTGSGRAVLTPDLAHINIGVQTQGQDASEAVASNNSRSQQVIDALREAGIAAEDIQTTNFSIYPQQQYDNEGRPTGEITYIVDNTVFVTVRNLDRIGEILDAAVQAGANTINGIQFDVADRSAALSDARQAAIENARTQAEEVAQAAGVELGQVQSINIFGGEQPPIPVFQARGGMLETAQDVPVSPGQMIVNVQVNVVYTIQ